MKRWWTTVSIHRPCYSIEGGLASGQSFNRQVEARALTSWIGSQMLGDASDHHPAACKSVLVRAIKEVSMESVQRESVYLRGWHDCDGERGFLTASVG